MKLNNIIKKRIVISETDILLSTDLTEHELPTFIHKQRSELKSYN